MNKNITVFGDSLAKGIVTKDGRLEVLENNCINLLNKYYNTNINNVSYYGQTLTRLCSKGIIEKYIKKINSNEKNIVVIELGGNDSDYDWREIEKNPREAHNEKTPLIKYKQLLEEITSLSIKNNIEVILTTLPPICEQRYFENVISKIADKEKVLLFLNNDITNIYRHQELYNQVIINVAKEKNIKLIDLRSIFLSSIDFLDYLCEDGIHLNEEGHKLVFEYIKRINDVCL